MSILPGFFNRVNKENVVELKELWDKSKPPIYQMRDNQVKVYNENRNSKYFKLNQPPGSGKSMTIAFCMANKLKNNINEKVLIVVPQNFIANSFRNLLLQFEDGSVVDWNISNDFCENINGKKTKALIRFLKKKDFDIGINERIAITTHLAFSSINQKIKGIDDIFKNTTVIIDEAHHVLYSDCETSNRIGEIIENVIKNERYKSSLWLVTATPYRGDNNCIIPNEVMERFEKHYLPFDEHWKNNIKYIESFEFNFVIYKKNQIFNEVRNLIKMDKSKTIIFCPFNGQLLEEGDKRIFRDLLIKEILEEWPECKILDLIEDNGRDKRKEILTDKENAKGIDIILTLKIFDEGSDWVPATRCIDLYPSNSLGTAYQRFGRPWRDSPEKKHIQYFAFLPYEAEFKDEEERRLHLSKSYNIFTASLLLQEIVEPLRYPSKLKGGKTIKLNPFEEAVPDDGKRQDILQKVIYKLLSMKNINENPEPDEVKEWIGSVLTNNNIENQEGVINHIAKIMRRNDSIKQKTIWEDSLDLEWMIDAGFDKIWTNEIFDSMLVMGTNTSGIKDFEEFRCILSKNKTMDEWIKIASQLTPDQLNDYSWLKNNIPNLYAYMNNNEEVFKLYGFIRKKSKLLEERIKEAMEIAPENLNKRWLDENNKFGLYQSIRTNKGEFEKRGIKLKTAEECLLEERIKEFMEIAPENLNKRWLLKSDKKHLYKYFLMHRDELEKHGIKLNRKEK